MLKTQEPKYAIVDNKIVNRKTGMAIPDDEPVIIFRAKDVNVVPMLWTYLNSCKDVHHQNVVEKRIVDFITFQHRNPGKVREPDSDISCVSVAVDSGNANCSCINSYKFRDECVVCGEPWSEQVKE